MRPPAPSEPRPWLARLVDARAGEGRSIAWATLHFFLLLASYYTVRPVRETLGIRGGVERLTWVWTGTMAVALATTPLFAALVARYPRRKFVPIVYHVAALCLVAFWALLTLVPEQLRLGTGYAFYVWLSVFNLFVVAVFWGFLADLFVLEQARRLFPFIAVGGTVGALVGAQVARRLAQPIGSIQLLLVAALFLEGAILCVQALSRLHAVDTPRERVSIADDSPGGGPWSGARIALARPYLRGICAFMLFHALFNTVLYYLQSSIVDRRVEKGDAQTVVFATIDSWTQGITLVLQLFVSGRLIRWFGVTFALMSQPCVAALGCALVGLAVWKGGELTGWTAAWPPELLAIVVAMVSVRAASFATARPARESLYTVVEREVKYKSKGFVDTFVYRFGDTLGMWTSQLLVKLGLALPALALGAVPLAFVWMWVGRRLGREQRELAERPGGSAAPMRADRLGARP